MTKIINTIKDFYDKDNYAFKLNVGFTIFMIIAIIGLVILTVCMVKSSGTVNDDVQNFVVREMLNKTCIM